MGHEGVVAYAVASPMDDSRTIADALDAIVGKNITAEDFALIGKASPETTDYPFLIFQSFPPEAEHDVFYAHWGHKDAGCLLSLSAARFEMLEDLVISIVANLRIDASCAA